VSRDKVLHKHYIREMQITRTKHTSGVCAFLRKWGRLRSTNPLAARQPPTDCWPTQATIWQILIGDPLEPHCDMINGLFLQCNVCMQTWKNITNYRQGESNKFVFRLIGLRGTLKQKQIFQWNKTLNKQNIVSTLSVPINKTLWHIYAY
jgi:hypothetical protein